MHEDETWTWKLRCPKHGGPRPGAKPGGAVWRLDKPPRLKEVRYELELVEPRADGALVHTFFEYATYDELQVDVTAIVARQPLALLMIRTVPGTLVILPQKLLEREP